LRKSRLTFEENIAWMYGIKLYLQAGWPDAFVEKNCPNWSPTAILSKLMHNYICITLGKSRIKIWATSAKLKKTAQRKEPNSRKICPIWSPWPTRTHLYSIESKNLELNNDYLSRHVTLKHNDRKIVLLNCWWVISSALVAK
jgi:hypothetical protein